MRFKAGRSAIQVGCTSPSHREQLGRRRVEAQRGREDEQVQKNETIEKNEGRN